MRALLDVNVWIALLDSNHTFAERVNEWFSRERPPIATCPIVENGVVRIMSGTGYSANAKHSAVDIASLLRQACANSDHEFWPDDASLLDQTVFDVTRLHGSRQVTDAYLLALAVTRGAYFATLDGAVPLAAVRGSTKKHVLAL